MNTVLQSIQILFPSLISVDFFHYVQSLFLCPHKLKRHIKINKASKIKKKDYDEYNEKYIMQNWIDIKYLSFCFGFFYHTSKYIHGYLYKKIFKYFFLN